MSRWGNRFEDRTACWIGLDGSKKGWSAALLTEDGQVQLFLSKTLTDLWHVEKKYDIRGIAIDIPLALALNAERGGRQCDRTARRLLAKCRANVVPISTRKDVVGPSSIFTPPSRPALDAFRTGASHAEVSKANLDSVAKYAHAEQTDISTGLGLSIQAYHIMPKIVEADDFIEAGQRLRRFSYLPSSKHERRKQQNPQSIALFECHPELAFIASQARRSGVAIEQVKALKSKKTLLGRQQRCELLTCELTGARLLIEGHGEAKDGSGVTTSIDRLWTQSSWRLPEYSQGGRVAILTDDILDCLICVLSAKRFTTNKKGDIISFPPAQGDAQTKDHRGMPMTIFA